jgi:hypothetical protein
MQIVTKSTAEFLAALDRIKSEGRRIIAAERAPGGHGWTITVTDKPGQQFEPFNVGPAAPLKSTGSPSPGGFGRM